MAGRVLKDAALLPPELLELEAIAAGADAALDTAAMAAPPGVADAAAAASAQEAEGLAAMLGLVVSAASHIEPAAAKYYTPAACSGIAEQYLRCAEKYGWTWHQGASDSPEFGLAVAVCLPAFLVYKERTARLDEEARRASSPPRQLEQAETLQATATEPA